MKAALGADVRQALKQLMWGMRRNPSGWTHHQLHAMHWLQNAALKSARASRLKMALREVDHPSNAFVKAMNGLLQQAKRAARGFRTSRNFIAIAYLRMSKLKHLPASPFAQAVAR